MAAFSFLSLGLFLLAWQWRATPLSLMGKGLVLAGIFLGVSAGVPLTVSVGIHVFSVMLAFVFWMLSIYGILRHPSVAYPFRFFSGVIFALVLLLGGMGPQWIALGLVERLVLALLLAWQVTVSFFRRVKPFSVLD